jgi:carbonic anhydrase
MKNKAIKNLVIILEEKLDLNNLNKTNIELNLNEFLTMSISYYGYNGALDKELFKFSIIDTNKLFSEDQHNTIKEAIVEFDNVFSVKALEKFYKQFEDFIVNTILDYYL